MAAEMLEELDLAQSALGQNLFAENIGDLLDGDTLVCCIVNGGAVKESGESAGSRNILRACACSKNGKQ
jgi:hypothetical protein